MSNVAVKKSDGADKPIPTTRATGAITAVVAKPRGVQHGSVKSQATKAPDPRESTLAEPPRYYIPSPKELSQLENVFTRAGKIFVVTKGQQVGIFSNW